MTSSGIPEPDLCKPREIDWQKEYKRVYGVWGNLVLGEKEVKRESMSR